MKNIVLGLWVMLLWCGIGYGQVCEIRVGTPRPPVCGDEAVPIAEQRVITLYEAIDCDAIPLVKGAVADSMVLTIDPMLNILNAVGTNGLLVYSGSGNSIGLDASIGNSCYIVCSKIKYTCGSRELWSVNRCVEWYAPVRPCPALNYCVEIPPIRCPEKQLILSQDRCSNLCDNSSFNPSYSYTLSTISGPVHNYNVVQVTTNAGITSINSYIDSYITYISTNDTSFQRGCYLVTVASTECDGSGGYTIMDSLKYCVNKTTIRDYNTGEPWCTGSWPVEVVDGGGNTIAIVQDRGDMEVYLSNLTGIYAVLNKNSDCVYIGICMSEPSDTGCDEDILSDVYVIARRPDTQLVIDGINGVAMQENGSCVDGSLVRYEVLLMDQYDICRAIDTSGVNTYDLNTLESLIASKKDSIWTGDLCEECPDYGNIVMYNQDGDKVDEAEVLGMIGNINASGEYEVLDYGFNSLSVVLSHVGNFATIGDIYNHFYSVQPNSPSGVFIRYGAINSDYYLTTPGPCTRCTMAILYSTGCDGLGNATIPQDTAMYCQYYRHLVADGTVSGVVPCPTNYPISITDGVGNVQYVAVDAVDFTQYLEGLYSGYDITVDDAPGCMVRAVCYGDNCGYIPVIYVKVPGPPSTVINAPSGSILPAPSNDDGGCAGGFVSETYDIYGFDGGGYVSIALFPVDLCDPLVFNGLTVPVGTTSLTITSTVTTNCGSDTDNYILAITESGGVVTGVNGVSCQLPPTTTINPISGTILPSPTNNDMGCTGGFIDEKLRINWDGLFIDLPINGAPYDLCDYLLGQPINVLEPTPMTINSSVTTDCGIDTDQINITVLQSGGFITGVNGVLCPVDQPPTTDIIGITGTVIDIIDTQGYNGGVCSSWVTQTIDITTANGTYGSFNVVDGDDLCTILSQYNTGNVLDHKNIPVVITRNVQDCSGTASDTIDTFIEFNNGILIGINNITCPCLEVTPSMVVGGNNVCAAPYGYRTGIVITDASAPIANINGVMVNYEVRDQDGNVIVSPTTVIPPGSTPGTSSAPLPDILGTHRYVIVEEVTDINGCVAEYYGYNTVSLRINCLVPTPRKADVNTTGFTECGASGGLSSSLASIDGDSIYDIMMLEGFSGVSDSQIASQSITVTNQSTGESKTYTLVGEWDNLFYDATAEILIDFPSGLNSGNTIELSGTVTYANGCTTAVQTGSNTLP